MNRLRNILIVLLLTVACLNAYAEEKPHKYKIKTVRIAGNHAYTDKRLHRVIISKPSVLFNPVYYYPDVMKDDMFGLALFYQQNGYLQAVVEEYTVTLDSLKKRADIRIRVNEGNLTRIDGITIFDKGLFSDSLLMRLIPLKPGDPLRHVSIGEGTVELLKFFANHGYLDAEVTPEIRIDSSAHLASIDYVIKEESQFFIDSTIVQGLKKTRMRVVMRELEFKSGGVVNYSRLLDSQRKLYLTGLFQSVYVKPVTAKSGKLGMKDILIELKEGKSREYSFSLGYGTVERARTGIGLFNTNWRGTAQKIGLSVKLSFVQAGIEATFSEPWTFNTRWSTDLGLLVDYLVDPTYDQKTIGGRMTIGKILANRWSTSLTYRHQSVALSNIKSLTLPDDIRTNIRSLKLTLSRDLRNNLFNPTAGTYLEQSIETAGLFRSASESFTRIRFLARYFKTITNGTVIGSGMELAWLASPRGFDSIILSERLYAGGPSSLRAFKYKHAGPLDIEDNPTGGGFLAVWNVLEVRQSIYRMIGGVVFLDVGNVWLNIEDASWNEIRLSPGIGIRVDTPLGLFRTDYGINIDRDGGEPSGMFYFSVGQAF